MTSPPGVSLDEGLLRRFRFECRGRVLDCRPIPHAVPVVMGILNITPDSFSDGGAFLPVDDAVRRAEQMLEEGARIIDVGGESTRPRGTAYQAGATPVNVEEELRRIIPVIEAVARRFPESIISVDTYKSVVAERAVDAGAVILNDVTGLRYDPGIAAVAARHKLPLIVMHSLGLPGSMAHEHAYTDVLRDVTESLQQSLSTASRSGVEQLSVDPGFGFGKSTRENLQLIRSIDTFLSLNYPITVGISRKTTIGRVLRSRDDPAPVDQRLFGTLGATAHAVMNGASIVRTHDVRPTVEMLKLVHAVAAAT